MAPTKPLTNLLQDRANASRSRRQFLRDTTAATAALLGASGAAAAAIPQQAAPTPPPAPPAEPLRIGVIGVGGMGSEHVRRFVALNKEGHENVRVVAVADVCKPKVEAMADWCRSEQGSAEHPFQVDGYRDYRELLARKDIQGVLIASPEHWHAQMAIDAVRAGKDVYVEKPMTLRLDQAFAIWREQRVRDRIVQVGTQFVMQPKYAEARRLIAEGAIGHPVSSQTSYCRNTPAGEWNYYGIDERLEPGELLDWDAWCGELGPRPFDTYVYHRWRRYKDFSTGIIGDLLVHVMTPLVWALDCGWPVRVTATGGHYVDKAMENHDQVNVTVQFEKEHTMEVLGSTCNATGLETLIRGHRANLYLGGNNCELRPEQPFAEEIEGQSAKFESVPDQDLLRLDWLKCIRTREPNRSPVDLGIKVMVAVDLAARALWQGGSWGFQPASLTPVSL
jgi:predicted dehydrogenase